MILVARWPNGGLQAQWINPTPDQERNFRRNMDAQGCKVTAYTDDEYAQLQTRLTAPALPVAAVLSMPRESEPKPALSDAGLPAVGQAIMHPLLGWATVTHTVTFCDAVSPVATGPRGQSLVKPGEWRAATEADRPFWMRHAVDAEVSPPLSPVPKPMIMPSLF